MTDAPILSDADLDFLRGVDSPTIANALERMQLRDRSDGYLGGSIQCAFPELGPMVGTAVTVTVDNAVGRPARQDGYWALWETLERTPGPIVIVMKDASGTPSRVAYAGEIMVTLAARLGRDRHGDGWRAARPPRGAGARVPLLPPLPGRLARELRALEGRRPRLPRRAARAHRRHPPRGRERHRHRARRRASADFADEVAAVQKAERRDMDFIDGPDFTLDGYKEIRGYGR